MTCKPNMNILAAPISKLAALALLLDSCLAQYTPIPRWGQATAVVADGLYVHGGSSDPTHSFPYASAPPINDLLYLSLASPFNPSSPPWQLVSSSANPASPQGPALSWHTLSAFRSNQTLLFGGKFGANSPTVLPSANDSVVLLGTDNPTVPVWTTESPSWANEPIRRMRHTASTLGGNVFLIGGEKADGSGLGFDTNYVFDISVPSFSPLPFENGPPDVSGHASVVLPDGRLLILGGYSLSGSVLLPLNTVWILDATRTPLQWSSVSVANSTVPSPRRGFVAAALSNGQVVIHGGSDANYDISYDDGWILDTTKNPMAWTSVPALTQLGARRDHFAIALGNLVIFGFGYGNTSAAPAELQIYDSASGLWASSYVPPPNTSPTDSFGGPSSTPTGSTSVHGSPTPTATTQHNGGATSSSARSSRTAIAIVVTLAVLALLATSFFYFYLRRRRGQHLGGQFRHLGHSHGRHKSHQSGSFNGAVLIMNDARGKPSRLGWFTGLGILESNAARRARHERERRDILADEDTRHFSYGVESGIGSTWSLRSMGAMIGGAMGIRSREPSTRSWREKSDPFSDNAALMTEQGSSYAGHSTRPRERRQQSYSSVLSARSYIDPFSDPIQEVALESLDLEYPTPQVYENPTMRSTNVHPYPTPLLLQTIAPQSAETHIIHAIREQSESTRTPSPDQPLSLFSGPSSPTSFTSLGDKGALPLTFGANPPPEVPIRRSDSWWSRFMRTSFVDRRPSNSSRRYIDFRDPNPPPRLGAIAEASTPTAELPRLDIIAGHSRYESQMNRGKSMSSMRTTETTDTAAIEKLGEMVVVQRAGTPSHQSTESTVARESAFDGGAEGEADQIRLGLDDRGDEPLVISPATDGSWSPLRDVTETTSPWRSTGFVATRVEAYERKLSFEQDLAGLPAAPVNAKLGEEKTRKRGYTVNYGLAPRPSLFITNPDTAHGKSPSPSS